MIGWSDYFGSSYWSGRVCRSGGTAAECQGTKSLRDIFRASQRVADFGHRWRLLIEGAVVLVEAILPRSTRGASDEHPEQ
jgi:hypothetical protein